MFFFNYQFDSVNSVHDLHELLRTLKFQISFSGRLKLWTP